MAQAGIEDSLLCSTATATADLSSNTCSSFDTDIDTDTLLSTTYTDGSSMYQRSVLPAVLEDEVFQVMYGARGLQPSLRVLRY